MLSDPIEIVPEEFEEKKEYLVVDTGEELEQWMDKEIGEYGNKQVYVDRAVMKAIARRSTWVKILRFLLEHNSRDFSRKEIKNALKMPEMTVGYALHKLVKSKILERIVPSTIDSRFLVYRIANLKVVEAIIKLHDQFVSFKLAKLLPYDFLSIDDLRKNSKFLELCAKYKLTVEEGIECLRLNTRKVECVFSSGYRSKGQLKGFRRKEQ